ncbi:CoF synthetase [Marinobacter sp. F3R08]|uniref:CoF synthetase n=1 Tax=Marinobacter sp. F3R08 TaxID=2841559 RepID=UPI001C08AD0E|nr:CoF synthetase [Marinobacter sp. F3R08]MBU2955604.1 CoF synthetase [Marinobacter sp. F3R08]
MIRAARFLLTRLFFLGMGLPISRYRKEVEQLWRLNEEGRADSLDRFLARNRPLNSAGIEVGSLDALKSSPSLSKKQLRSQPRLRQTKSGKPGFGRHTAGTTGEPTEVTLDRKELGRMLAVRDYCFRHYGFKLGQREARLWGRPESGVKSLLKNFVLNRRVFHPVGPQAQAEVAHLLSWKPDYVYGYASLLLETARIIDGSEIEFDPPKCVVCTAESILPTQKAYISRVFNAPVAEEYGSTEFDVIAFECTKGHRHLVNPWLVVEKGKFGDLISDVSRFSQNLIRYQLGDSFTIHRTECSSLGSTEYIGQLQGRTLDRFFYLSESEKIHASVFSKAFDQYFKETIDVFTFSLQQDAYTQLEVFLDRAPKSGIANLKIFLEQEISNFAGVQVGVRVSVVARGSRSEKRNYFVQNMKASE